MFGNISLPCHKQKIENNLILVHIKKSEIKIKNNFRNHICEILHIYKIREKFNTQNIFYQMKTIKTKKIFGILHKMELRREM